MIEYEQVIILNAELKDNTKEQNNTRTELLERMLVDANIKHNKAIGNYKDTIEKTFVCLPKDLAEIETLKGYAFDTFNQESVLHQDVKGHAWLVDSKGNELHVGKLRQVPNKYIDTLSNYVIMNNKVYTTEAV